MVMVVVMVKVVVVVWSIILSSRCHLPHVVCHHQLSLDRRRRYQFPIPEGHEGMEQDYPAPLDVELSDQLWPVWAVQALAFLVSYLFLKKKWP